MSCHDETITTNVSVPICKRLWEATFAEGGEVQGVRFLVHPTGLDVQVLEYVHLALETNLKHTNAHKVSLVSVAVTAKKRNTCIHPLDGATVPCSLEREGHDNLSTHPHTGNP